MRPRSCRASSGPGSAPPRSGRTATTSILRSRSLTRLPQFTVRRAPGAERRRGLVSRIDVDEDGALGVQRDRQLEREVAPDLKAETSRRAATRGPPLVPRAGGKEVRIQESICGPGDTESEVEEPEPGRVPAAARRTEAPPDSSTRSRRATHVGNSHRTAMGCRWVGAPE